jgi:hypothetical protein
MKTVNINCESNKYLKLDDLHEFQGDLKDLMEIDYQKMKKSITGHGIIDCFNVWFYEEKWWILDGHQRKRTLTKMREEGYDIPDLPVTVVKAKTYKDAKYIVLSLTSQFGTMTPQGLYEFVSTADLDFNKLNEFRLPEINMDKFAEEFGELPKLKEDRDPSKAGQHELDPQFIVSIKCQDESEQQALYEEMKERGHACKLIS